jgi:hypothetical protein
LELRKVRGLVAPGLDRAVTTIGHAAGAAAAEQGVGLRHFEGLKVEDDFHRNFFRHLLLLLSAKLTPGECGFPQQGGHAAGAAVPKQSIYLRYFELLKVKKHLHLYSSRLLFNFD